MNGIAINIDPVIVHLGGFALRWYSLAVAGGIGLAILLVLRQASRHGLDTGAEESTSDGGAEAVKMYRAWALLALATAAVALAAGCGSGGAPATPTPTASTASVRGAPALAVDKLGVDLGTVARDQQGVATFLVMNMGDRPLQVGPMGIWVKQGGDAAEVADGTTQIQPGSAILLPIELGPHRVLGPHHLLVTVPSNDPERPVTTLSVRFLVAEGEAPLGTGPRLRVDKEVIDTGTVPYDWPLYEQFVLRNGGDAPLVLEGEPQVRVEVGC